MFFNKEGDIFGEIEFFTDKGRLFSAKSISYSSAYVIYLEEFKELLKSHPEDLVNLSFYKREYSENTIFELILYSVCLYFISFLIGNIFLHERSDFSNE